MKFKKIIAALLSSALLLSLCACGETDETKIAVIVKSVDSDFWQNFKSGVESAATEYNVSVTFEGPENEENYAEQNKMISRAAENGADVIVLSAIDRTRCAPTVNAAVRSGVRVIAADSALDSPLISLFIGTDNPESGISAAKALEAQFSAGEKIKLGIVGCSEKTENILKREEGLREYFAGLDNAEVVAAAAADSNIESAESKAAGRLLKNPEINALIGLNEWTTLGVGAAIKKANAAGKIKTVGFDTNTVSVGMLETGEMGALIVQNPFAMGYLSVKTAAELKNGEQPGGEAIYTAVTTVSKENMYDPNIQKILFSFKKG